MGDTVERVDQGGEGPRRSSTSQLSVANAVTALRVALVPVVAVLVAQSSTAARWWALGVFVFAALTDTVDGYVARRVSGGITRWGQLADPLADKLLILGVLVVLAWRGETPWWAVVVISIREIGVTVQRTLLVRRGVIMPADRFGKAKTVAQIVYICVALAPGMSDVLEGATLWIAVALTVGSGLSYARRGLSGGGPADAKSGLA